MVLEIGKRYFFQICQPTYRPLESPIIYNMHADFMRLEMIGGEERALMKNCNIMSYCLSFPINWIRDALCLEDIPQLRKIPLDIIRIIERYV